MFKKKFSVSMLIEIESQIEQIRKTGAISYTQLVKMMHHNTTGCDIFTEALILAYNIPKAEIQEDIKAYDNSRPKMDAVKFADDLADKYGVERDWVVKRIQHVRMMNKFESNKS